MRQIGTIPDETDARRLADYLLTLGITSRVDRGTNGWAVWVHREDQVVKARDELNAFLESPQDPRYRGHSAAARALRKEAERAERQHAEASHDVRAAWGGPDLRRCPLMFALMLVSVVVTIGTHYGRLIDYPGEHPGDRWTRALLIASFRDVPLDQGPPEGVPESQIVPPYYRQSDLLQDLRRGEVWRLVTPIFLHFNGMHLLFNMLALYQFGGMIELRKRTGTLAFLVVVSAVLSNLAQYYWTGNPGFGGMSGVDLALFGYIWMKSQYEPESGLGMTRGTVTFIVLYLAVTIVGGATAIAHAAHLAGVVVGVLIGLGPHLIPDLSRDEEEA